ncbi:MAG: ParB/RepB/Spo0J family partition protein [Archangium sp.]|nr:ParB/RepB/Spo0J family partition protein [Archangium sp.]MDP3575335.1 ParB/RepB/Spo0J family partition protein [Archangium sp.]
MKLTTVEVDLAALNPNPWQPRRNMDADELATLAASIREQSLLQPIVVQPLEGGRYVIVAGHRRVAAYEKLHETDGSKWARIPALVRTGLTEAQLASLAYTENVARSALTPVEEGRALQSMVDAGLAQTNEDLAALVQQPVARIKRLRRLASGPRVIRDAVDAGFMVTLGTDADGTERRELRKLELNSALCFVRLHEAFKLAAPKKADERIDRVIRKALAANWSVRRCETFVEATIAGREPEPVTDSAPVLAALFTETKRRFVVDLFLAASASAEQLAEVRAAFERALASEPGQR